MREVDVGIANKFDAGGVFNTLLGGRLYKKVPSVAVLPYSRYRSITVTPDWTFTTYFESTRVQFDIFSKEKSSSEIEALYSSLIKMFDWCTLEVDNYTFLYMRREFSQLFEPEETQADYWHYVVDYRIDIEKISSPSASPSASPS